MHFMSTSAKNDSAVLANTLCWWQQGCKVRESMVASRWEACAHATYGLAQAQCAGQHPAMTLLHGAQGGRVHGRQLISAGWCAPLVRTEALEALAPCRRRVCGGALQRCAPPPAPPAAYRARRVSTSATLRNAVVLPRASSCAAEPWSAP